MKIGIFVHSNTGNTYSVAEKLRDKLVSGGHSVIITKIEPVGGENINESNISRINFNPAPNVSGYDSLVICAPVRAFSLSPVINSYLNKIASLKGQKIDLFVTQQLPYQWMGGKNAIAKMKKICEEKGAVVTNTGIINWKSKEKEAMVADILDRLGKK